eukprot:TRINITY_DN43556_c0_g1_i1.p1 TRINITY_DN43556_c0_g1~~TRINITY_DN43556_c0_g1_i1.p1  ORF type:complete len:275 (+),score=79.91 TRINITY_DN43556_c0_g1_i1:65-826(+)
MPVRTHVHSVPPLRRSPRVAIWEPNPAVPFDIAAVMHTDESMTGELRECRRMHERLEAAARRRAEVTKNDIVIADFSSRVLVRKLCGGNGEAAARKRLQYAEALHRSDLRKQRDAWHQPRCLDDALGGESLGRVFMAGAERAMRDSIWRTFRERLVAPYGVDLRLRQGREFNPADPAASPAWVQAAAVRAGLADSGEPAAGSAVDAVRRCLRRWEAAELRYRCTVESAEQAKRLAAERYTRRQLRPARAVRST